MYKVIHVMCKHPFVILNKCELGRNSMWESVQNFALFKLFNAFEIQERIYGPEFFAYQ